MGADRHEHEHDRFIAIWSKAVDTQMHFNEMSVKSRQLGLTFVAAALGVAVVLLTRGEDFSLTIADFHLHVSVILLIAALLAIVAVRGLDLNVYHRMLRGAVTFGEDFEENYMKQVFDLEKGMTQTISHYSRYADAGTKREGTKNTYTGTSYATAEDKIRKFYRTTIIFLIVAAAALLVLTNIEGWAGPDRDVNEEQANEYNKLELPMRNQ